LHESDTVLCAVILSMSLPAQTSDIITRRYVPWLWLMIGLFTIRVIAQPCSLLFKTKILPPFESWHGAVLPYPVLLLTQLLILAWLVLTARQFTNGSVSPNHRLGVNILIFACIYFTLMLVRLVLGLTILSDHRWFASALPAFFHLVLASFLLLYGHFHFKYGKESAR